MNLVTWNMQGGGYSGELKWRTGVGNLLQAQTAWRPNVVCLQETGVRPPSAEYLHSVTLTDPDDEDHDVDIYGWGGSRGRPAYTIAFYEWDEGGHRVNLAIVSRTVIDDPTVDLVWTEYGASWRPALGMLVDGDWIHSLHAISPRGPDAAGLLDAIDGTTDEWWAAGDFNREPDRLVVPDDSVICPPRSATHPVRDPVSKYDYCVRTADMADTGTLVGLYMSDHYPVAYVF